MKKFLIGICLSTLLSACEVGITNSPSNPSDHDDTWLESVEEDTAQEETESEEEPEESAGAEEEPEEELEEVSSMAGGAVEGGATKSPFVNFDEEENHKN